MFGTAGLPHVIVRFFTVPNVSDARKSAGYALIFIAILYSTAPAVSAFARMNFIDSVQEVNYQEAPSWFRNWENIGLIAWKDKNEDGLIQYSAGNALEGIKPDFSNEKGVSGERVTINDPDMTNNNEVYIDRDIMVLANPEIARLPSWVVALVAAGALAAALSTAAGLLLVISASISHDLLKKTFMPKITEKQELFYPPIMKAIKDSGFKGYVAQEFIPKDKNVISATTDYSSNIVCSVEKENIFGTQFHPEKSDKIGLKMINNFINL